MALVIISSPMLQALGFVEFLVWCFRASDLGHTSQEGFSLGGFRVCGFGFRPYPVIETLDPEP